VDAPGPSSSTLNLGVGQRSFTADHAYADDDGPGASTPYAVQVTVTDDDAQSASGGTSVTVNDVAPTPAVSGPSAGQPSQPRDFTFSAGDVSAADQAAGFSYAIDWGDGSPV